NRINCEQANCACDVSAQRGTKVERVYRSDRDDWILAMVAAGLGFAFMPQYSIVERADIVVRPLVEPEFWREVSLVTVRGRPHSPAIGALVREAMRTQWLGAARLAVRRSRAGDGGKMHCPTDHGGDLMRFASRWRDRPAVLADTRGPPRRRALGRFRQRRPAIRSDRRSARGSRFRPGPRRSSRRDRCRWPRRGPRLRRG